MSIAIKVENLSKIYRLGEIGTGTISRDLERWWVTQILKKEDPFLKIGEVNDRAHRGQSDIVYSLRDINLEINQGDAVGIIGKNGAGKSTLLKILSRVTSPSIGDVKIRGRIASLLEVGTGFHPELTGRENIYLNGAILGMRKKEIDRKLEAIVDFSGVERYIDTPVKRYSSGMYVRLAFSVAAHLESEILIIDEVLAVGDNDFQKKCLGKMGEVSKGEGRTVLFVSHNMAAINSLCDTCVMLKDGKLHTSGKTHDIIEEYINSDKIHNGEISGESVKYETSYSGVKVEKIRTKNDKGLVKSSFGINEAISIEIIYQVLNDGEIINPSIHLLDNIGNCIFATFNADSANLMKDNYFGLPLSKGLYSAICKIPPFFLNDSNYIISVFLVPKSIVQMTVAKEVISFSVFDTGEMRKEYTDGWIGLIRPKFAWNTSKLSREIK